MQEIPSSPTARTDALTELILETFRLNGRLLEAGDALVRDLGLTSARWQVLGAIAAAPAPVTVAQIARNMGLSRQGVQRLADAMSGEGQVRFETNPHHARAKLVIMTAAGRAAFEAAMVRQRRWAAALADGLKPKSIEAATGILGEIRARLEKIGP